MIVFNHGTYCIYHFNHWNTLWHHCTGLNEQEMDTSWLTCGGYKHKWIASKPARNSHDGELIRPGQVQGCSRESARQQSTDLLGWSFLFSITDQVAVYITSRSIPLKGDGISGGILIHDSSHGGWFCGWKQVGWYRNVNQYVLIRLIFSVLI